MPAILVLEIGKLRCAEAMCLLSVAEFRSKTRSSADPSPRCSITLSIQMKVVIYVNSRPTSTFLQLFFLASSQLSESPVAEIRLSTETRLSDQAGNDSYPRVIQERIYLVFLTHSEFG